MLQNDPSRVHTPAAPTLPQGAAVILGARTHTFEGGRVLVGGSPSRVARLSAAAASTFRSPTTQGAGQRATERVLEIADSTSQHVAGYLVAAGLANPDPHTLPAGDASEVTVVVPCYQRTEPLRRLLQSIRRELPNAPVIVVDDGSGERSPGIAAVAEEHRAQLVAYRENRGPAAARNAGLSQVRTRYVLFVDTDVVLRAGSIDLLLRHFVDEQLAAIAPRVVAMPQSQQNWVLRYEQARSSLDHGPHPSLVRPHSPQSWLSTTCLLVRKDAMGKGFTPGMRVAEDVDLVWRLNRCGWRVRYEPQAVAEHEHRATVRGWLGRKYIYGTGAASLARLHGDLVAPAVMSPWAGAVLIALAAQRRWSVPAAATIAIVATGTNIGKLRASQPDLLGRTVLALRLTKFGLTAAVGQGFALLIRHWWPATVAVSLFSPRVRRLLLVAGIAEAAWEYARLKPTMDPVRFALARRLDDLAYGLGVWASAVRARSVRALLPTRPRVLRVPGTAAKTTSAL